LQRRTGGDDVVNEERCRRHRDDGADTRTGKPHAAGAADLPAAVGALKAGGEREIQLARRRRRDRLSGVEASPTQTPWIRRHGHDGSERPVPWHQRGDGLGRDAGQGQPVAELERGDQAPWDSLVRSGRPASVDAGDEEGTGARRRDRGLAPIADVVARSAWFGANAAEGWGKQGRKALEHLVTVPVSALRMARDSRRNPRRGLRP
jgi:hypothetical protein